MIRCFMDLETTGLDPQGDRIVEIMLRREDDSGTVSYCHRVNPTVPIPPQAAAVHGITDEMVAGCPTFEDMADDVQSMIEGAVIIGYNSRSFDVPMLQAELLRANRPGFPLDEHGAISIREVDLLRVWRAKEKRDLATAARRFAGTEHAAAHSAEGDVAVLAGIMSGMTAEFAIDGIEEMERLTTPENAVDRDGKFVKNAEGKIVFAFGKNEGKPVSRNIDYVEWMLGSSFSPETKAWCRRFIAWSKGGGQP